MAWTCSLDKMRTGKKVEKRIFLIMLIFILSILSASLVNSQFEASYSVIGSPAAQYYSPRFSSGSGYTPPKTYWPEFGREDCRERQDFIIQVVPVGCQPEVVRSDLLEEQNIPVFCKLMLIQANPLVDVARVKSIRFPGRYAEGIAGISYFPSRIDLRTSRNLAETPIDDDLGYFVVNLKRQKSEDDMPDWVEGNLTAVIEYDLDKSLGIGRTNFYLSELSDDEWLADYKQYGFWNGKGYVRAESIEEDKVTVSIYRDMDSRISSTTLDSGESSEVIYLPGFYCTAGLKIRAEKIDVPVESALLQVDEEQVWVAKGDRILDTGCSVREVDARAGGGRVSLSCPVKNGKFDLTLNPWRITLSVGGKEERDYDVGDKLDVVEADLYVAYTGKKGEKFAVFINDPHSSDKIEFADKGLYSVISNLMENRKYASIPKLDDEIKEEIQKRVISHYNRKVKGGSLKEENILIIEEGKSGTLTYPILGSEGKVGTMRIEFVRASVAENHNWELETNESKKLAYDYYKEAVKNYEDLADLYPHEKRIEEDYFEPYAAEGLYRASSLTRDFNMSEDRERFLEKLKVGYPDSAWTRKAESEKERLLKYDSSSSRAVVNLRDGSFFIEVLEFKEPKKEELSVDLLIDGKSEQLGLDEVWSKEDTEGKKVLSIQVTDIDDDYVTLQYTKPDLRVVPKSVKLDLERNKQTIFEDVSVKLVEINLEKQVKLSLDSQIRGPRTYANFSFKIGIEKRAIDLSPEKTKEMMENVGESIEKWEDVNEKLGKVIKGMKGACFATSAMLIVKNMFEGFGGKSMARSEIMTGANGWNDYCEKIVSTGKQAMNGQVYSSPEKCLLDHNSYIEKHIETYTKYIEKTNNLLDSVKGQVERTDILDFEGQLKDRAAMEKRYRERIKAECQNWNKIELPKKGEEVSYFNPSEEGFCDWGGFEDMKDISTLYNTLNDPETTGPLKDMIKTDLARVTESAKDNHDWQEAKDKARKEMQEKGITISPTLLEGDKSVLADIKTLDSEDLAAIYGPGISEQDAELKKGDKVMSVFIPAKESFAGETFTSTSGVKGDYAIIKLGGVSRGIYGFERAYTTSGFNDALIDEDVQNYLGLKKAKQFKESKAEAYEHRMTNVKDLRVKYFDRAPYKGLPAEIPFDTDEGWYVELEYVLSGFGKPYDESGRAVNYYICNVGENGLIEFKRGRDDICRYYNGVSGELGFPGMSGGKSRELVNRANRAIIEASRYYGKEEAIIEGRKYKTGVSFGGEAGRCTDFMSPEDCHWMFNLCDPVICPTSRCDLGGEFPVDNVIQTGVIGSLVLCLPNIKEGIIVPVCLSGVHAGIESYLSILEAEKACLNESLETGRNVGICDEITSVYKCEFFWKQLVPFADVLIPKLIESFFKQGVRGGGEYLTVQNAWANTEGAINYFKNEYAVNSIKAFNVRSTEEVGSEICKAFVSTRYPTDLDLFVEPDSPVQYHAWFDENIMTTATPYPTSHYKVYYHIYAGNDQGAYYTVYLKDISENFATYYTYTSSRYAVARGYLARGQHVDEARDFTAPSGYKQLCVNINGKDECDFGKVSTSFALDYLSDRYAAEQAEEQITSSEVCIAGTPSLWSMAQPNIQAGAEEFVEPELYNRGIVRVCSTYNPGKQVDARGEYDLTNSTSDRWKDVGYCDDKTIRCWLDTNSVKTVIQNKELEKQALGEVDIKQVDEGNYLTGERSIEISKKAEEYLEDVDINYGEIYKGVVDIKIQETVKELTELANSGPSNSYRAEGLLLLGRLYDEVAKRILGVGREKAGSVDEEKAEAVVPAKGPVEPTAVEGVEGAVVGEAEEEGRIFFKKNWAVGSWPRVNNRTFVKYEIDLVDTKFVKRLSSDGDTLYASTDKTDDKLDGTWRLPTAKQKQAYDSGNDFLSEEVRITVKKWAGITGSFPVADVESYRKLDVEGQETKFVVGKDTEKFYISADGGVTWKEADVYQTRIYLDAIAAESVVEEEKEKEELPSRIASRERIDVKARKKGKDFDCFYSYNTETKRWTVLNEISCLPIENIDFNNDVWGIKFISKNYDIIEIEEVVIDSVDEEVREKRMMEMFFAPIVIVLPEFTFVDDKILLSGQETGLYVEEGKILLDTGIVSSSNPFSSKFWGVDQIMGVVKDNRMYFYNNDAVKEQIPVLANQLDGKIISGEKIVSK